MRDAARAAQCQRDRENSVYLPGYRFSDPLQVTADLDLAVTSSDVVFISVPSSSFREVTRRIVADLKPGAMIVSTTKGIEPQGFTLMSQILEQEIPGGRIGVLSGPNFAKEIVQKQQTGTVIASSDEALIQCVQTILCSDTFRVYANHDRYGVELGGALKNIYAIVSGMAAAIGAGQNTLAMLLTRSLAEMGRFAGHLGADPMTFLGLAGVGDLILTCTSDLSRNYRVGLLVGQGKTLEQATAEVGQTAEGINTVRLVKQKADELNIYMPLVQGLHAVLFEGVPMARVAKGLMMGEQNTDVEYRGKL
jgi:glycerol-3-phosphate dehydrogenase (NAD(P)+)